MIEIYPSNLAGDPIERHAVRAGTLHDWLTAHCPSYRAGPVQPITASVDGGVVPPAEWPSLRLDGPTVELRPAAMDVVMASWIIGALLVGSVAVALLLRPNIPKLKSQGARGQDLRAADIQANQPRLNQVIPEIAGRYKVYPDYLCQPRRYFVDANTQAVDVLLCIGRGEFAIDADDIRIGETALAGLGDTVDYTLFAPGADVSGHTAHRNWYNAPEVGASVGSAGLRLTAGTAGTPRASATNYRIDGDSISIPPGAGVAPQDWDVGHIVRVTAYIRTITVVDGGGAWNSPNRDLVRGSFGDIGLAAGDVVMIFGSVNAGRYRVNSLTSSVSEPGSASTITAVKVAPLAYASAPITFDVGAFEVALDEDYTDADDLVAAINAQIGGSTASHTGGVVKLTEDSPYSGLPLELTGYFDPVFGAAPDRVTGVATQSYDEMTLDSWAIQQTGTDENGNPIYAAGWMLAGSMTPGVFGEVDVLKPRLRQVSRPGPWGGTVTADDYVPTEYRITALITGTIPDGAGGTTTGVIGWSLQRLDTDGTDDAGWAGFYADATTPKVTVEFDDSQVVGGWLGPFRATPANETAQTFEFDIFATSGLAHIGDDGGISTLTRSFEVQRRTNGGAWTSTLYAVQAASRDQLGWTYQVTLPAPAAAVDFRIRRIGAESGSLSTLDRLEWYGLRCLLPAPSSYAGVTTMALTLTGSDKISARTENQINLIVTRKLNGAPTRSIDDWVRYVCSSIGYAADDINEDELTALASVWDARGDWYDRAIVDTTTVKDELATALRAGFSELTIDNGQIRPVRDQPRTDFEHLYSLQNAAAPLRRKFSCPDPDDHDGVDVEYISADTWKEEVVQCRLPGDVGTRVEKITLDGITDRTRAWRIGMRARRAQVYRRKQYSFGTEWDALNSRYLSYCALADDVPGYGQSALVTAWLPDAPGGTLRLSEPLTWTEGASHVVALRRPDGTLAGPYAAAEGADAFSVAIADDLDFEPITGGSQEPTHSVFGTTTTWSYPVLITDIEPSGDTVDVSAVNYDARIYEDDDHSPPG